MAVCGTGFVGLLWEDWQPVTGQHLGLLACTAAILMVGYICSILAMRNGEVSFVSPFRYTIMVWALLLGLFVFGDVPGLQTLAGALIIAASGLYTLHRESKVLRQGLAR